MREQIKDIFLESIRIKEELMRNEIPRIIEIAEMAISSLKKGGKLIIFGNGGSAADSQHIAAEFVGRFQKDRPALPALSLTVNTSVLTAVANDYSYETVFSRQIEALGHKNDLSLGISTSGKAKNVAAAIKQAKKIGMSTAALTGGDGGELAKIPDVCVVVPSTITARIQEAHITIGHIICEIVEHRFFYSQK